MPKIQARFIKAALREGEGLEALFARLEEKLSREGFQFKINKDVREKEGAQKVEILRCPWHDIMVRPGWESLSENVSRLICTTKNPVWALEFGDITFYPEAGICKGSDRCILRVEAKP